MADRDRLADRGDLRVSIDEVFPLSAARAAFEQSVERTRPLDRNRQLESRIRRVATHDRAGLHQLAGRADAAIQSLERAIALSHETYCSASIMLAKTADITTSFDLIET